MGPWKWSPACHVAVGSVWRCWWSRPDVKKTAGKSCQWIIGSTLWTCAHWIWHLLMLVTNYCQIIPLYCCCTCARTWIQKTFVLLSLWCNRSFLRSNSFSFLMSIPWCRVHAGPRQMGVINSVHPWWRLYWEWVPTDSVCAFAIFHVFSKNCAKVQSSTEVRSEQLPPWSLILEHVWPAGQLLVGWVGMRSGQKTGQSQVGQWWFNETALEWLNIKLSRLLVSL